MKTIIMPFSLAASLIMILGCESENETLPASINHHSFSETELLALIDQSVFSDPAGRHGKPIKTYNPVLDMVNGGVQVGNSMVIRNHNGASMSLMATMEPGHTATVWWVIFNNPENCSDGICGDDGFTDFLNGENTGLAMLYAAGTVAANNGVATFAGHLKEGVIKEGANQILFGFPEQPLVDAETADIRLVVRSHGPKIPGQVGEQISSHGGGCDVDIFPPFSATPMSEGECGDIYVSLH